MDVYTFNKLMHYEQAQRNNVFTDEADILKVTLACMRHLNGCCVIRQEAVHRSGIPDLVVCFEGYFVAIELKDNTGVQSELQKEWENKIKGAGGTYILADNVDIICSTLISIHAENGRIHKLITIDNARIAMGYK